MSGLIVAGLIVAGLSLCVTGVIRNSPITFFIGALGLIGLFIYSIESSTTEQIANNKKIHEYNLKIADQNRKNMVEAGCLVFDYGGANANIRLYKCPGNDNVTNEADYLVKHPIIEEVK